MSPCFPARRTAGRTRAKCCGRFMEDPACRDAKCRLPVTRLHPRRFRCWKIPSCSFPRACDALRRGRWPGRNSSGLIEISNSPRWKCEHHLRRWFLRRHDFSARSRPHALGAGLVARQRTRNARPREGRDCDQRKNGMGKTARITAADLGARLLRHELSPCHD